MMADNLLTSDLDHVLDATGDLWQELRGEHIFITGATGFFGCWLLESFAWANRRLDLHASATILSRNPQHLWEKVPHLRCEPIHAIAGDIRDFPFPSGGFSHVIHAAAESSTDLNARDPQRMFDTIVEGTRRCLEFASHSRARKFLFVSSGAVYGKQPLELSHIPEDFYGGPDPTDVASAYAEGKRAAELLCTLAGQGSNLEIKIARCFAFVGPYMKLDSHFAIGNFMRDYLEGAAIRVQGDGSAVRSYMYASDLMIWLWTILFRGESCRAYNVGSEDAINIADLAREVASARTSGSDLRAGKSSVQILGTPVPGSPVARRYVPSTARAQKELRLRCTIQLREAIERTIEWNRAQHAPREIAEAAGVKR